MSGWAERGLTIVSGLLAAEQVAKLRGVCAEVRERWLIRDPLTNSPGGDSSRDTCMRHAIHPDYFRDRPQVLRELLEVCAHQRVIEVLRSRWGEEPIFRSTSLFFNPTQLVQEGNWHRDSQYVFTDPAEEKRALERQAVTSGEGIQVQLPLIDNDDFEYVLGSHRRWDTHEELRIRLGDGEAHHREPMPGSRRIAVFAGDGVFFDPNGIHRGRYHATRPRLTLMVTYTRASAPPRVDRFSYQPWFLESGYLDGLSAAAHAVYCSFVDRYREAWAAHPISASQLHSGRRFRYLPS